MSDHIYIPPNRTPVRRQRFIPPLLIFPFLIYNVVAFVFLGGNPAGWNNGLFAIFMVSGTPWVVSASDFLLVISLVLLFIELIKSTRLGTASIVEHMLSMIVFVAYLIEFLLVGAAASSVFFLLTVMSLIDVVAGFTVSITGARRDFSVE